MCQLIRDKTQCDGNAPISSIRKKQTEKDSDFNVWHVVFSFCLVLGFSMLNEDYLT